MYAASGVYESLRLPAHTIADNRTALVAHAHRVMRAGCDAHAEFLMSDSKSKIVGYDGGDGEPQLLAALKEALAVEVNDAWEKVRVKYMYIGSIIDIAKAKGLIKKSRLGFAGYMATHVGYAEKTCRDCLRCWEKRRDFNDVREWVATTNLFKPEKPTGPMLYLDSHKAWSNRLKSGQAPARPKTLGAKELRKLLRAYQDMLDRVGGEHVKQAEINHFEPRVWNAIVQERAALEVEMSKTVSDPSAFPVDATRDEVDGDDENQYQGTVPESEHSESEPDAAGGLDTPDEPTKPEQEPDPPAQASQPESEPEPQSEPPPQPQPLPLVPATTPPPDLPNLDDLDDRPDVQPHDDAPAICLPDGSQSGPDIQAEIERLRANPYMVARETYQRIMGTRLPPVRKLARVRRLIAEMYRLLNSLENEFARFWDEYGQGIDFIRLAMKRDSPKFDQMGTFKDYLDFACALAGEAAKEKGPR